ncbi:MAG: hypothetical protein OXC62_06785 [Aestuariivita sp.]|nr:hypothetical protein [Aestuariivita sp.]
MLSHELGPLNEKHQRFVTALDLQPVETFFRSDRHRHGRSQKDRYALARPFIAKAIRERPATRDLIDRLPCDPPLRRLMGVGTCIGSFE